MYGAIKNMQYKFIQPAFDSHNSHKLISHKFVVLLYYERAPQHQRPSKINVWIISCYMY